MGMELSRVLLQRRRELVVVVLCHVFHDLRVLGAERNHRVVVLCVGRVECRLELVQLGGRLFPQRLHGTHVLGRRRRRARLGLGQQLFQRLDPLLGRRRSRRQRACVRLGQRRHVALVLGAGRIQRDGQPAVLGLQRLDTRLQVRHLVRPLGRPGRHLVVQPLDVLKLVLQIGNPVSGHLELARRLFGCRNHPVRSSNVRPELAHLVPLCRQIVAERRPLVPRVVQICFQHMDGLVALGNLGTGRVERRLGLCQRVSQIGLVCNLSPQVRDKLVEVGHLGLVDGVLVPRVCPQRLDLELHPVDLFLACLGHLFCAPHGRLDPRRLLCHQRPHPVLPLHLPHVVHLGLQRSHP